MAQGTFFMKNFRTKHAMAISLCVHTELIEKFLQNNKKNGSVRYKSLRIQGNNANGINASPRTASQATFYFVLIYLLCIFAQHKTFLVYVAPVFLCFKSYASNIFLILFMVSGVFRLCSRVAFEFYAVLTMLKEFFKTNICTKRHCPVSFLI